MNPTPLTARTRAAAATEDQTRTRRTKDRRYFQHVDAFRTRKFQSHHCTRFVEDGEEMPDSASTFISSLS